MNHKGWIQCLGIGLFCWSCVAEVGKPSRSLTVPDVFSSPVIFHTASETDTLPAPVKKTDHKELDREKITSLLRPVPYFSDRQKTVYVFPGTQKIFFSRDGLQCGFDVLGNVWLFISARMTNDKFFPRKGQIYLSGEITTKHDLYLEPDFTTSAISTDTIPYYYHGFWASLSRPSTFFKALLKADVIRVELKHEKVIHAFEVPEEDLEILKQMAFIWEKN